LIDLFAGSSGEYDLDLSFHSVRRGEGSSSCRSGVGEGKRKLLSEHLAKRAVPHEKKKNLPAASPGGGRKGKEEASCQATGKILTETGWRAYGKKGSGGPLWHLRRGRKRGGRKEEVSTSSSGVRPRVRCKGKKRNRYSS